MKQILFVWALIQAFMSWLRYLGVLPPEQVVLTNEATMEVAVVAQRTPLYKPVLYSLAAWFSRE